MTLVWIGFALSGTPQSTAARSSWALVSESSVVAHLAQSLDQHFRVCLLSLLIFWEVIYRWTLVSEMSGGKLRGLEQVAKLLPGAGRGGGEAAGVPPWVGGAMKNPPWVGGAGGEGESSAERAGRGRAGELWWGVRRGQPWPLHAEVQKGGLRGVSRAFAG